MNVDRFRLLSGQPLVTEIRAAIAARHQSRRHATAAVLAAVTAAADLTFAAAILPVLAAGLLGQALPVAAWLAVISATVGVAAAAAWSVADPGGVA